MCKNFIGVQNNYTCVILIYHFQYLLSYSFVLGLFKMFFVCFSTYHLLVINNKMIVLIVIRKSDPVLNGAAVSRSEEVWFGEFFVENL